MSSSARYDAIVFDLLDTLYPWGPDRYSQALDALCDTVAKACAPVTSEEVKAVYVDIRTRYSAENLSRLVENDFPAFVLELTASLGAREPGELAREGVRAYNSAFAAALELPGGVFDMLRRLSTSFNLGVLSNYPTSGGIRQALQRDGLANVLKAIVVSAEVGYIKPHPAMFRAVRGELGCPPDRVLFVGDTFESDVVGAWLAGMPCVRITPSASGVEQGQFFNGHIRKWLESQTDLKWRDAKPIVELENVAQLERWLEKLNVEG
ncbi:MAG: HAD-IA family hydrolase [Armatimonadota bacterium]|nr:HAD-IA family hydrolase [Armatimonadota bacterium]